MGLSQVPVEVSRDLTVAVLWTGGGDDALALLARPEEELSGQPILLALWTCRDLHQLGKWSTQQPKRIPLLIHLR